MVIPLAHITTAGQLGVDNVRLMCSVYKWSDVCLMRFSGLTLLEQDDYVPPKSMCTCVVYVVNVASHGSQ